ncbi:unnamed protein product [Auanema sp. JU1783]|nr:unnamed protein product [Auanema sp. JU1783]
MDRAADTHVLIIGNGPAGLSLSAFLSGITPYYNADTPHPNSYIHEQLCKNEDSLLDQDLSWCENVDELGGSGRPLSVLLDSLIRPEADLGNDLGSSLFWERDRAKEVPHIVLGETEIGGSWNNYDPQMLAVSFASWLDLPGYSVADCLQSNSAISRCRLPSMVIASYMECYAKELGLTMNIQTKRKVTSITKEGNLWRTTGRTTDGRPFSITSNKVVLACGRTVCRTLEISNEHENKNIVYDVPSLKARIKHDIATRQDYTSGVGNGRVVIIGDGISSADIVRFCLKRDIAVLHVMRRNERQLRHIMMARLSPSHYAEYHQVHRLMTGKDRHPLYERKCASSVTAIDESTVTLSTPAGILVEPLCLMAVCIGRVSDTDAILQEKLTFDGYNCEQDDSMFAIGSLAGDHFVRYLVGGALEVARMINSDYKSHVNNNCNKAQPNTNNTYMNCKFRNVLKRFCERC